MVYFFLKKQQVGYNLKEKCVNSYLVTIQSKDNIYNVAPVTAYSSYVGFFPTIMLILEIVRINGLNEFQFLLHDLPKTNKIEACKWNVIKQNMKQMRTCA